MKKLIVLVALLCVPVLASAQKRDAVLTPEGLLYSVQYELAEEHPDVRSVSDAFLTLTVRTGQSVSREIVPATIVEKGAHFNPAIAYDSDSGMLFVFWIHHTSMLLNQLMFVSRDADGVWSEAKTFGALYDHRRNLRLAVTRKFENAAGESELGLSVHLAWWEFDFTTAASTARYALATIENGKIAGLEQLDLASFVPQNLEASTTSVGANVLNQPLLFPAPKQDSVLLVYGDLRTGTMQSLRIRPKVRQNGGRLRVPGGKREGTFRTPSLNIASTTRLEAVYGDEDRIAFFGNENGTIRYTLLKNGSWSTPQAIGLDEQFSSSAAIDALRRLVNEH